MALLAPLMLPPSVSATTVVTSDVNAPWRRHWWQHESGGTLSSSNEYRCHPDRNIAGAVEISWLHTGDEDAASTVTYITDTLERFYCSDLKRVRIYVTYKRCQGLFFWEEGA